MERIKCTKTILSDKQQADAYSKQSLGNNLIKSNWTPPRKIINTIAYLLHESQQVGLCMRFYPSYQNKVHLRDR